MFSAGGGSPSLSVIVPSLNSALVAETLRALRGQTAADEIAEILVVGRDEPGLVKEDHLIRFVETPRPVTSPVARNIGIGAAKGSILTFTDADCIPQPVWLEQLLRAHGEGHSVVGGALSLEGNGYWQLCYNVTMFHEFLTGRPRGTRSNLGAFSLSVTRQVVEQVGLMDESLDRSQDTDWTLRMRRAGYDLYFWPAAVVRHLPAVSGLAGLLRLWQRTGYFSSVVRRRYPDLLPAAPFSGHPWLISALSPLIAAAVTMRILAADPSLVRLLHVLPVVYATKVAWCLGAGRAMSGRPAPQA